MRYLKKQLDLTFLVNPYYLYCITFSVSILFYLIGWSDLYPNLSFEIILFLVLSFMLFLFFGKRNGSIHWDKNENEWNKSSEHIFDYVFIFVLVLGVINILIMGYIPLFNSTLDYRDFGVPVLDPIFNSLSIFFSVISFQLFLGEKKKRYLLYTILIIIFHLFIFRRASVVWISISSVLLYILYKRKIRVISLLIIVLCIPFFSLLFGSYGNFRSKLDKDYILNDLGASSSFSGSGLSHNHYMTYVYETSPLANLQKNIDEGKGFLNNGNIQEFVFYSIMPQSVTLRLEKLIPLKSPVSLLVHPHLIVGTFFMIAFHSLGWAGMILMLLYLLLYIGFCSAIITRWHTFRISTYCILSTMVFLLIFSNFLNRLDVILILLIYPVLFHKLFNLRLIHRSAKS
jgi:oligosaccharide repeat unit polymerase